MKTRYSFAARLIAAQRMLARGAAPGSPHVGDQMQAANAEARQMHQHIGTVLPMLEPERNWRQRIEADPSDTVRAHLLAALGGCTEVCCHLRRGGPQPAVVSLPLRRIDCRRCVATVRRPPPDEDHRCDVCGKPETLTFVPFAMRQGPVLLAGDACTDCAGVLGILQEAVA